MTTIPQGFKRNPKGHLVPIGTIQDIDLLRDSLVRDLVGCAMEHSLALADFKRAAFDEVAAFVQLSAEQYGAKIGGREGNVTLTSYDGLYKIQIAIAKTIIFGEQIQAAKSLIDECIHGWSSGSPDELKALVNDAFQVDQQGKINTDRVLGLRRIKITDPKWQAAMQAISDAIMVVGSKSYIRVYMRNDLGEYVAISLDVAAA